MQINGCDRNTGNKQLLSVQDFSSFPQKVLRHLHIVIFHGLYDPAVLGDGVRVFNVILAFIHTLNGQSLISLLITFPKRHDDCCQTVTVHFLNEVKDVLAKTDDLFICMAIRFNVIYQPLPVLMPDTNIPAKTRNQPILDGFPGVFISGIPIKTVVVIDHRHLANSKLFPAFYIQVVVCNQVREIILHADVMVLVISLDTVQ